MIFSNILVKESQKLLETNEPLFDGQKDNKIERCSSEQQNAR